MSVILVLGSLLVLWGVFELSRLGVIPALMILNSKEMKQPHRKVGFYYSPLIKRPVVIVSVSKPDPKCPANRIVECEVE